MSITNKAFLLLVLNVSTTNDEKQEPKWDQNISTTSDQNQKTDDEIVEELTLNPVFFCMNILLPCCPYSVYRALFGKTPFKTKKS